MSNCNVIKDLIPLKIEGLLSNDSDNLVEEHLKECEDCRKYYASVKHDYEMVDRKEEQEEGMEELVRKISKYQKNIKLGVICIALLLSSIIVGGDVQFLSTFPVLILVPFVCRWFYNKTIVIILLTIPCSILGGALKGNTSFIPFLITISLVFAAIGAIASVLVKEGLRGERRRVKVFNLVLGVLLVSGGCFIYAMFNGNPVGYVKTAVNAISYVKKNYEDNELTFKGVYYNFKFGTHDAKFEYILNGLNQVTSIGFYRDGTVNDGYKYALDSTFCNERARDIGSKIEQILGKNIVAFVSHDEEISISKDALDDKYRNLSYDEDKLNKAEVMRKEAFEKIKYEIFMGKVKGEYISLSKEELIEDAIKIQKELSKEESSYEEIILGGKNEAGINQTVTFKMNSTEEEIKSSYKTIENEKK
ncbi:MAG: zf-HC2 domain-containing protein [Clostridium sp.]|uniref:YfjL-like protein n=1 Tax=Clostridium sp. TaxID=1506 RepID=UPI002A8BDC24|nr:zf-HC2 domain-containing protein [Clostridium sp.]MDY5097232.1 zf-HC2 domain-containing protein [Clostridium sp.]